MTGEFIRAVSHGVPLDYAKNLMGLSGVRHAFTTREGGVSRGHLASLNLGRERNDAPEAVFENYRRLGRAVGFSPNRIAFSNQNHGDNIRVVDGGSALGLGAPWPEKCDALLTDAKGIPLLVFAADCTPILLACRNGRAVGAVHAGWRGTALGTVKKAALELSGRYGVPITDVFAAIGPSIGPCCFEVDGDVAEELAVSCGVSADDFERRNGKWYPDLKALNARHLVSAGVPPENIAISESCTMCESERFFSNRKHGKMRGLHGALILLADG